MATKIKTKEVNISADDRPKLEKNRILLIRRSNCRNSQPIKGISYVCARY